MEHQVSQDLRILSELKLFVIQTKHGTESWWAKDYVIGTTGCLELVDDNGSITVYGSGYWERIRRTTGRVNLAGLNIYNPQDAPKKEG